MRKIKLSEIVFGDSYEFVLIAGPCVIESEESAMEHAEKIRDIARLLQIPFVFKASYDKANRTSLESYRGPGIEKGLKILEKIKRRLLIPVLTDVHTVEETREAARVVDILQIPAFLCRQTDLLTAAAETGKVVNVKKGQFLSPWDMKNVIHKIEAHGNRNILITERGASFGYSNLVSDFRAIPVMRGFGYPVVFDATHSVQIPGGLGTSSGGQSEFIPTLSRCAIAAGADALFLEVHEHPARAKSDGKNSLPLNQLKDLLVVLKKIRSAAPVSGEKKQ